MNRSLPASRLGLTVFFFLVGEFLYDIITGFGFQDRGNIRGIFLTFQVRLEAAPTGVVAIVHVVANIIAALQIRAVFDRINFIVVIIRWPGWQGSAFAVVAVVAIIAPALTTTLSGMPRSAIAQLRGVRMGRQVMPISSSTIAPSRASNNSNFSSSNASLASVRIKIFLPVRTSSSVRAARLLFSR